MTQAELAARVPMGEPQRVVSSDAVWRIEHGERVESYVLRPVLVFLGLACLPDLTQPAPGQQPGDWLRDLRETHGISPTGFCARTRATPMSRPLSRTTLMKIEREALTPKWGMLDGIEAAFNACGVTVSIEFLDHAWLSDGGPALADAWGPDVDRAEHPVRARVESLTAQLPGTAVADTAAKLGTVLRGFTSMPPAKKVSVATRPQRDHSARLRRAARIARYRQWRASLTARS